MSVFYIMMILTQGGSNMEKSIIVEAKLRRIAKYLNIRVKNRKQNDHGYFTVHYVHRVNSGCCIRVHHWLDNTLSIDLLISRSAEGGNFSDRCNNAINVFNGLFDDKPNFNPDFRVNNKPDDPYKRYWIDIVDEDDEIICKRLDKIKKEIGSRI